ncbi:hypothetical protein Pmani_015143 [Petrolisthes manimaculis]|uniref:Uncharacterized protein n=1 Tax=Petrolisthes manimaculis TaxID=1843537 RepID=A0AAE1PSS9_9EUCA|nr:hypothetical protein Pmani_015143 [Petrolisthes manimaculis]
MAYVVDAVAHGDGQTGQPPGSTPSDDRGLTATLPPGDQGPAAPAPSPPGDKGPIAPPPPGDQGPATPPSSGNQGPTAPPPTSDQGLATPSPPTSNQGQASASPVITNTVSTPFDISKLVTQNVEELINVQKDKTKLETKDLEIEYFSTEIKVAYSIIETLQQRVSELEQQANKSSRDVVDVTGPPSPTHCLLLGDSNLRGVIRFDLADTCSVRTITEANMDLLRSWVSEKLTRSPSECMIYGGVCDILNKVDPETILDSLGSLISDLKEKNAEMKIYVCEVVPIPKSEEIQTKISEYNEHLENGVKQMV